MGLTGVDERGCRYSGCRRCPLWALSIFRTLMGSRFAWRRGSSGGRCESAGHAAPGDWAAAGGVGAAAAALLPPLLLGDVLALDPAGEPLIWGSEPGRAGVG